MVAMARSIALSSVLTVLYFAGCASPASADIAEYTFTGTLPGVTITGGGQCGYPFSSCPSGEGPALEFSLPQFNPALGSLQSVSLVVDASVGGSATLTNEPINCLPFQDCHNNAGVLLSFGPAGSFSTGGSSYQLDFGGLYNNPNLVAFFGQEGGTESLPFGSELFFGIPAFPPPSPDSFVGNGQVNLFVSSVLNILDLDADSATATVDPSQLEATLDYTYTPPVPAVPEPSLLVATAGILGLLAIRRVRGKSTS